MLLAWPRIWVLASKGIVFVKAFKIASVVCLLSLSLLYPLIEWLDHWDAPGPSSDSEIQIIALLTLVGIVFLVGDFFTSLSSVSMLAALLFNLLPPMDNPRHTFFLILNPTVMPQPPLALRI